MASPFPGMDPYLEAATLWPAFQQQLVSALLDVLQASLGDRYRLRSATRVYVNEQVLFTSVLREEQREEFLEIRQRGTGKVVTVLEVVSPANRTTPIGRKEYQAKREDARRQKAHLVEVDLILQGHSCLDFSQDGLPQWDYAISVSRANQPDRYEVYTATLQKRLPRFRVPLTPDDRDVVVDLQAVFERCYDRHFANKINYKKDPPILLKDGDYKWLVQHFKQLKLR